MAKAKEKKLGTGLSAIFGEDYETIMDSIEDIQQDPTKHGGAEEIAIEQIMPNPYQPRQEFDETALQELADSIAQHGVFTPILVKRAEVGYILIAGERRLRASKLAGKTTIPAMIQDFTDEQMMEISLLENIQREDLTAVEEANSYRQLIQKLQYTQEELAKRIGKSREHVTNMLRLLKLPQQVQQMVSDKQLSMGQVRPLITLENEDEMIALANRIAAEDMPVRQVEKLVKERKKAPSEKPKTAPGTDSGLTNVQHLLQKRLQTTVAVQNGEIRIKYTDVDDLNRILEIMNCLDD